MKNVDLEIYITNLINFFENNPNDLMSLIGDLQKQEFYEKLRERSEKNYSNGDDFILTRNQIVEIVVELKIPQIEKEKKSEIDRIIQKTKFGEIFLN
jgi:hypothetical protein